MPLAADDLDEARAVLRSAGRDAVPFRFRYVARPRLGCAVGEPPADVIVTHTGTGVSKTYAAARWLAAFSADVAGGHWWRDA